MYAVIGLAIGYFAYRRGYGNLISATFRPLLGDKAAGGPGRAIDVVAIFATLFGSATSLGLGALQITGGIDNVFGRGAGSKVLAVFVIVVLTLCFVVSAVSGVERGIKYLANANAVAAALLVFFLFVVGPTVFILSTFTQTMGDYLTHLPSMAFNTGVYDTEASSWLGGWTIFYWAWWISWTPFVGMFIAQDLRHHSDIVVRRHAPRGLLPHRDSRQGLEQTLRQVVAAERHVARALRNGEVVGDGSEREDHRVRPPHPTATAPAGVVLDIGAETVHALTRLPDRVDALARPVLVGLLPVRSVIADLPALDLDRDEAHIGQR